METHPQAPRETQAGVWQAEGCLGSSEGQSCARAPALPERTSRGQQRPRSALEGRGGDGVSPEGLGPGIEVWGLLASRWGSGLLLPSDPPHLALVPPASSPRPAASPSQPFASLVTDTH